MASTSTPNSSISASVDWSDIGVPGVRHDRDLPLFYLPRQLSARTALGWQLFSPSVLCGKFLLDYSAYLIE